MDNLEDLEDLTSLWTFDEDIDDLKKQLESKTNELEAVKRAAIDQTKKYNDNVTKLIRLLGRAYKERDEAKDKLQKLLLQTNQALAAPSTTAMATFPTLSSQSPSIAVNNTTTAHAATSTMATLPSLSPQSPLIAVNNTNTTAQGTRSSNHQADWAIIENLAKGGPRPRKGQLSKAVWEASQLFNSVTKAGSHSLPVPQTPPQVAEAPQVPLTPVRVHKARGRPRTACTYSQMFNGSSSSTSLSASNLWSPDFTDQIQMPKRQCIYIEID